MRASRRRLLPGLAGLALLCCAAGCDRIFHAALGPSSTPEHPTFLFGTAEDLSGEGWVHRIRVAGRPRVLPAGADVPKSWRTFWEIGVAEGERYAPVRNVGYGELPPGFVNVSGPEPLVDGYLYVVHVGYHGLGNDLHFEIDSDARGARRFRRLTSDEFLAIVRPAAEGAGGAAPPAPGPAATGPSIGSATMKDDGTIVLMLRAEGPGGAIGDALFAYPPGHKDYKKILDHVGGLKPGEHKPVPPWPDEGGSR